MQVIYIRSNKQLTFINSKQTSLIVGLIGSALYLHRRIIGLKIVQLTYDYTSTANSKRKHNLLTMRQFIHLHLNAFEACLEGRLQLVVLRCIGLAWPPSYSPVGSPPFTISVAVISLVSSWSSVKTSCTDKLPSSSVSLAARLRHFSPQKLCHGDVLVCYVKCEPSGSWDDVKIHKAA